MVIQISMNIHHVCTKIKIVMLKLILKNNIKLIFFTLETHEAIGNLKARKVVSPIYPNIRINNIIKVQFNE